MGQSIKYIWMSQGLYPCLYLFDSTWYSLILFWIGVFYWIINLLFAASAVSRITYKQLKGDEFYTAKHSRQYVKRHWHAIIFSPIAIISVFLFFFTMASIFALLGSSALVIISQGLFKGHSWLLMGNDMLNLSIVAIL